MTIDHGDLPKPTEIKTIKPAQLLFHSTNTTEQGLNLIKKFGLLANLPTLTPLLYLCDSYGGGQYLTFWYPKYDEVNRRPYAVVTPKKKVSYELKQSILGDIKPTDRDIYAQLIEEAKTYLPSNRLRAVAKLSSADLKYLSFILGINGEVPVFTNQEDDSVQNNESILTAYANNQKIEQLVLRIKKRLEKIDIDFIDPSLNTEILANDMINSYFEFWLLISAEKNDPIKIQEIIKNLTSITYNYPAHERYRKLLISSLEKKLQTNK